MLGGWIREGRSGLDEKIMFHLAFMGGWVSLKELGGGTSYEVENVGLTFLKVEEVMEEHGGERDVIKAEDNNNSTKDAEGVRSELTKRDPKVGDLLKERGERKA